MRLSPGERLRGKATTDPAGTSGRTCPPSRQCRELPFFASAAGDPLNPLTAHGRGLYAVENRPAKCAAGTDPWWIMGGWWQRGRIINIAAPFEPSLNLCMETLMSFLPSPNDLLLFVSAA